MEKNLTHSAHSIRHKRRMTRTAVLALIFIIAVINKNNLLQYKEMWKTDSIGYVGTGNAPLQNVGDEGESSSDKSAWNLLLVNKENPIPQDYDVKLKKLYSGQYIDARIYQSFQEMIKDARKEGIYLVVTSGYRTFRKQQSLMNEKIEEFKANGYSANEAEEKAQAWVAIPGTSEHQLGLALDINGDGVHTENYKAYSWLSENSYRYGFILRYPPDKTEITGISDEPWHFRYVGTEAAAKMFNKNLCLEEYISALK